jgi:hypothetical protein
MHNWIVLNNFKFALNLTLKGPTYFGVKHHHQGTHYLSFAKVTVVKMSKNTF